MKNAWMLLQIVVLTYLFTVIRSEYIDSGQCGVPAISGSIAQSRIVNGNESVEGHWPWQVLVRENGVQICGGTLIGDKWVISAAHCLSGDLNAYSPIVLGAYKRDGSDDTAQEIPLKLITCHEDYVEDTFENDICVMELAETIQYTDYILPACLPTKMTNVEEGNICTVTGWGDTEGTGDDTILREANIRILNTELCESWYNGVGILIPALHFCAGYKDGMIDTCQGDSGGPLVCLETSISGKQAYVVRGITSFGLGCAEKERPGVYTDVVDYIDWIENIINQNTGTSAPDICSPSFPGTCGGHITEETEYIRSPKENAGTSYPANSNCTWTIRAPENNWIKLTFNCYFFLPQFGRTCNDYVTITDHNSDQLELCGMSLPEPVEVRSNAVTLNFISDGIHQSHGFVIKITFTPALMSSPTTTTQQRSDSTTTSSTKRNKTNSVLFEILFLFILYQSIHF